MNTSDETNPVVNPEDRFVKTGLAKIERTVRFGRIRQIVEMAIVFPAAYYITGHAPDHPVPGTVIVVIGLMLVAVTAKIVGLINRNTKAILRAIADIHRK